MKNRIKINWSIFGRKFIFLMLLTYFMWIGWATVMWGGSFTDTQASIIDYIIYALIFLLIMGWTSLYKGSTGVITEIAQAVYIARNGRQPDRRNEAAQPLKKPPASMPNFTGQGLGQEQEQEQKQQEIGVPMSLEQQKRMWELMNMQRNFYPEDMKLPPKPQQPFNKHNWK